MNVFFESDRSCFIFSDVSLVRLSGCKVYVFFKSGKGHFFLFETCKKAKICYNTILLEWKSYLLEVNKI